MRFWKYQGIGNDFILLDGTDGSLRIDPEWCRKACDRHYGIGADGVLYVMPGESTDITMRIINADGSEAEMCGNGIRCVAKHAFDFGIVKKESFTVHTLAGDLTADVSVKDGKAVAVRIDMGAPVLDGRSVPVDADGRFIDEPFEAGGVSFRGNAVSMGNPHFIIFSDLDDAVVDRLGPILERHPFFPRRTNVEFCKVIDGKIHIRVYERGAAWTLACGTGACASTVAAALNGLVPFDEPVDVRLPGGWLRITADSGLRRVLMEGPAEMVFEGQCRRR
ncbi:MAG: diaminopimelate epimerase [Candidatus Methanomethylophilaceae archaeon]|nr:diaminopimelate epimerase [Candidatus Methanomethylophilaceae archaeon]MBR7006183.1 diaminopimelate epimerase [Candidatus Methanomethylophilaceae archaeon]